MVKIEKVKKERLDVLLVEQGLFESRENAKRHIMEGIILVNDVPVDKPGTKVPSDARLRIKGKVMPYVGRGGYKLEKAINYFHLKMENVIMADIGASTGGFTDCALQHGAKKVYAIDVGTNQLDWKLRINPQVINLEKTNIKDVTMELLGERVNFISVDISFISVLKIIPAVNDILEESGQLVILIKPQFEAGRENVGKGGIITDKAIHSEVVFDTLQEFENQGFFVNGLTFSPIKGGSGNIEFLALLSKNKKTKETQMTKEFVNCIVEEAHRELKEK
ncbi:ribosomal RNA large subunit methyltransferase J [Veillonellaceae bacterium DNF00626]|nr:ribosomal RNA large subunit methyltransferase J [Veillonellaceae bacterium DNF00626]